MTLAGALKMCGCTDRSGKPVLLCSYNDNSVRLYDLPTYVGVPGRDWLGGGVMF